MPICIDAINMADNRPRRLLFVHYLYVLDFTCTANHPRLEAGVGDGLGGGGLALAAAGPAHGEVLGRAPSLAVLLAAGDVLPC